MNTETARSANPIMAPGTSGVSAKPRRRRRTAAGAERIRYFLPKSGSAPEHPELGQEAAGEGEALVEALKSGQVFYSVIAWRAVPEMNGAEARIVKQPFLSG